MNDEIVFSEGSYSLPDKEESMLDKFQEIAIQVLKRKLTYSEMKKARKIFSEKGEHTENTITDLQYAVKESIKG